MHLRIDPFSDRTNGVPPPRQTSEGPVSTPSLIPPVVSLGTLRPKRLYKTRRDANKMIVHTFSNLVKLLLFGSRKSQLRNLVGPSANIPANHAESTYTRVLGGVNDTLLLAPSPSMSVSSAPPSPSATSCTATSIEDRPVWITWPDSLRSRNGGYIGANMPNLVNGTLDGAFSPSEVVSHLSTEAVTT